MTLIEDSYWWKIPGEYSADAENEDKGLEVLISYSCEVETDLDFGADADGNRGIVEVGYGEPLIKISKDNVDVTSIFEFVAPSLLKEIATDIKIRLEDV